MDPKLLIPLNVGQQRSDALVPAQMTSRHLCAMPAARGLDEAATLAGGPLERRRRPDQRVLVLLSQLPVQLGRLAEVLGPFFGEVM
jgi:hypothetical protein